MDRIRRLLPVAVVMLLAAVALAACGEEDPDPQQVIEETFSSDATASSGVLDMSLSGSVEGAQAGSGELSLTGPFQGDPDDPNALPQLDLTATVSGEASGISGSFEGGLVITEDNAYVEYQGNAYELGTDTFNQFKQLIEQAQAAQSGQEGESASFGEQCATLLQQAGGNPDACDEVDVLSWFSELSTEGSEDVGGTSATHVHGELDVAAMLENVNAVIAAAEIPNSQPIPDEQISMASDAITEATFDLYSTEEDRLLVGLDLGVGVDATAVEGGESAGFETASGDFSLRINELNEEQTIEAPADARPIDELLSQFGITPESLGLGLGGLGGLGGTGLDGSGLGGGGTGGGGSPSDAYFDCIAQNPNDIQKCEDLLVP